MSEENKQDKLVINRRNFLKIGAVGTASAAVGLSGCAPQQSTKEAGEVSNEVDSSGKSYSFEKKPAPIEAGSISEASDYEVVVVGGSNTGLAAAVSAAEEGAKVVCLEKLPSSMGAGSVYGFLNVEGEKVDVSSYADRIFKASQGMGDPRVIREFVNNSEVVGRWLLDIAESAHIEAMFVPMAGGHIIGDGETDAFKMLIDRGESLGAEFRFNAAAIQLVQEEGGRVVGVVAEDENGEYVQFNASKGVILATGGYNGDEEMIEKYIPWVDNSKLVEFSPITQQGGNDGDGLKMALWAGAQIGEAPHTPMIHFNTGRPPTEGRLFVNLNGERFANEGTSMEVLAQVQMRTAGRTGYSVWDNKLQQVELETEAALAENPMPGPRFPSVSEYEPFDTLEEAAASLGIDAEGLKDTVKRWNELVALGEDADFGADLSMALTIEDAPFYIGEGPGCSLAMMGGAIINEKMQVLNEEHKAIPGLYAGGNCVCGIYGPNYPMDIQSGLARAFTSVSGYLAGKNVYAEV